MHTIKKNKLTFNILTISTNVKLVGDDKSFTVSILTVNIASMFTQAPRYKACQSITITEHKVRMLYESANISSGVSNRANWPTLYFRRVPLHLQGEVATFPRPVNIGSLNSH